jgi:Protein of unknown function (DUF2939)
MGNMRWNTAILAVLLLAYAIWPVAGFFLIASTIETRDAAALARLVDFPALQKSLTKQIVATYIEITNRGKKNGAARQEHRHGRRHVLRRTNRRSG